MTSTERTHNQSTIYNKNNNHYVEVHKKGISERKKNI